MFFLFDPSEYRIDLCNEYALVRPAGRPSLATTLTVNIACKLLNQLFFIPATPISMTLTLPGGHKLSAKQNLSASSSPTLCHLIKMIFDMVMKQFKLNTLRLLLRKTY